MNDNKFEISNVISRADRKGKEIDFIYLEEEENGQKEKQDTSEFRQDHTPVVYTEG